MIALGAVSQALAQADRTVKSGNIPEGFWIINLAWSVRLQAGKQTLWIVKDDGRRPAFVSIKTDPANHVKINSWTGAYDGTPAVMAGNGVVTKLKSIKAGSVQNDGTIPNVGPYVEDYTLLSARKAVALCWDDHQPSWRRDSRCLAAVSSLHEG